MDHDLDALDELEPVELPLDGVLDLHNFRPSEVGELLPDWMVASRRAGWTALRVIHGKGTGALRARVEGLLARSPLVARFGVDPYNRGATAVDLHPPAQDHARIAAALGEHPGVIRLLQQVARVGPGLWVGAGAVRNPLWHRWSGLPGEPAATDVDVLWHDAADSPTEAEILAQLQALDPAPRWEAVNQALLPSPAPDLASALARWPETATALAARWTADGVELLAPLGLDDLLAMIVRRNPACPEEVFRARLANKQWRRRFPAATVLR